MVNTRLSPKATAVSPIGRDARIFAGRKARKTHHIMKEVAKDYTPGPSWDSPLRCQSLPTGQAELRHPGLSRIPIGSRPTRPPPLSVWPATRLFPPVSAPRPAAGPTMQEGLDILVMDDERFPGQNPHRQGPGLCRCIAGWNRGHADEAEAFADRRPRQAAEARIASTVETDNLAGTDLLDLSWCPLLGRPGLCLPQLRHLHLLLPHLLVLSTFRMKFTATDPVFA
jgi:hypothetical protein